MPLFPFLQRRRTEALIEAVAKETAGACRQAARAGLDEACSTMSVHELRGYVRGRVGIMVRRQAAAIVQDLPLRPAEIKAAQRLATERVVQSTVRELASKRQAPAPARRAA